MGTIFVRSSFWISYLADLYGVEVRALIQAVKRNRERFPLDFMLQLEKQEVARVSRKHQFAEILRVAAFIREEAHGEKTALRAVVERCLSLATDRVRGIRDRGLDVFVREVRVSLEKVCLRSGESPEVEHFGALAK